LNGGGFYVGRSSLQLPIRGVVHLRRQGVAPQRVRRYNRRGYAEMQSERGEVRCHEALSPAGDQGGYLSHATGERGGAVHNRAFRCMTTKASAIAHPIQGLVKYHGLRDESLRLPFHDSISVCTAPLRT